MRAKSTYRAERRNLARRLRKAQASTFRQFWAATPKGYRREPQPRPLVIGEPAP